MDAKETMMGFYDAYLRKRNLEETLTFLSEDVNWIGSSLKKYAKNKNEVKKLLIAEMKENNTPFHYEISDLRKTSVTESSAIFNMNFLVTQVDNASLSAKFRTSIALAKEKGIFYIISIHYCSPPKLRPKNKLSSGNDFIRKITKAEREMIGFYQETYDALPCGVAIYTNETDFRYIYSNKEAFRIHGLEKAKDDCSSVDSCFDMVFPEDKEYAENIITTVLKVQKRVHFEHRILSHNQEIKWIKGWIEPIPYKNQSTVLQSIYFDITKDRKQNEYRVNRKEL